MSNCCQDSNGFFYKKMRLGRLICSLFLFVCLIVVLKPVYSQNNPVSNDSNESASVASISVFLSDVDGDSNKDAVFENKNVKLIISSKTGTVSLYYLKGEKFEENIYPPEILNLGYKIDDNYFNVFGIEGLDKTFPGLNYIIEIEKETAQELIIKATTNINNYVDENTPDNQAFKLTRRFIFSNEGYSFRIENVVTNLKDKLIVLGNEVNGSLTMSYGPGIFMEPYGPTSFMTLKANDVSEQHSGFKSINDKGAIAGNYCGIGIKDQYFCAFMETNEPVIVSALASHTVNADPRKKTMDTSLLRCTLPKFNLGARESRTFAFQVYAGPLVLNELKKINRGNIANFGFLVTQMLELLRFFYSLFPSYGIAIILLTLLVRLILYPLTLKQTKEMAKMQKLQPKLRDIQDRYKDNPQKMNEEVLKLYTKNKVNPLGGCFPILLQLPIIMALFNTFRSAVELRKASFLWMSDLSKGDPYLILPIAIAALMYYQQGKSNIDPQQRQAMAFMPMMMLVITFSLPSGLLVYWFASSVLGLLQQLQTNRLMESMKEEK